MGWNTLARTTCAHVACSRQHQVGRPRATNMYIDEHVLCSCAGPEAPSLEAESQPWHVGRRQSEHQLVGLAKAVKQGRCMERPVIRYHCCYVTLKRMLSESLVSPTANTNLLSFTRKQRGPRRTTQRHLQQAQRTYRQGWMLRQRKQTMQQSWRQPCPMTQRHSQ